MDNSNENRVILLSKKFPGILFTLVFFFGTMLIAFAAEFLADCDVVALGLIGISLGFLIFGVILCKKRKLDCLRFCIEIIVTEIVLAVLILPTGLLEKFVEFRNQFDYYWEAGWLKGLQWVLYPCIPAVFLFLLALIAGFMYLFRHIKNTV